MRKLLCITLVFILIFSLCSCGNSKSTAQTVEDEVRRAVTIRGYSEGYGSTIGGKDIKSSSFDVSTLQKENESSYVAYGVARMVDVYGNVYTNNFSCDVTKDSDGSWSAEDVEYTSNNWNRE